ncbi:MAG: hypothetical protein V4490_05480 [Pseudomonadota bacterium]
MWHLKTRLGTFWIIPADEPEAAGGYVVGLDNDTLGIYTDPNLAVGDVQQYRTGLLAWDERPGVRGAPDLTAWQPGLPEKWAEGVPA